MRLITPTDPEGHSHSGSSRDSSLATRYYQLTHDYFVPSLREWLTRKQKETRRGRAELKLTERSALWNAKPENRHLPSLPEWGGEQRRVLLDVTDAELTVARTTLTEQGFISQSTIAVRTDASAQRHYTGVWSNQGAQSELRPAYAGFELVE